jgi:hypothetical protein
MTTPHKHADNMLLFAQDAQTTDKPWTLWEYKVDSYPDWLTLEENPLWQPKSEYRRKPPTREYHREPPAQKYITIGNIEVPEPLRFPPPHNTHYWYVKCMSVLSARWYAYDDAANRCILKAGVAHLTEEAARLHRDALIALNTQPGH